MTGTGRARRKNIDVPSSSIRITQQLTIINSYLLAEIGRFEEAIREATEALSRDPMSPLLNAGLALVLVYTRKLDQCIEQTLTAIEVDPNMTLCYWILGGLMNNKGSIGTQLKPMRKASHKAAPSHSQKHLSATFMPNPASGKKPG